MILEYDINSDLKIVNKIRSNTNINTIADKFLNGCKTLSEADLKDIVGAIISIKTFSNIKVQFSTLFNYIMMYINDRSGGRFSYQDIEEKFDYNLFQYLDTNDEKYRSDSWDMDLVYHIAYDYFIKNPNKRWLEIIDNIEKGI